MIFGWISNTMRSSGSTPTTAPARISHAPGSLRTMSRSVFPSVCRAPSLPSCPSRPTVWPFLGSGRGGPHGGSWKVTGRSSSNSMTLRDRTSRSLFSGSSEAGGSCRGQVPFLGHAVPGRKGECRVHPPQLVAVQRAEACHDALALRGQLHSHRPPVAGMRCPLHEPLSLRPVDQLDYAVVTQLEPVGQLAHGRPLPAGKAFERQQQLILLRCQAVPAHRFFAEAQITADAETESGQRLEILLRESF